MKFANILMFTMLLLIVSCNETVDKITSNLDYDKYLQVDKNEMLQLTMEDCKFWENKLEKEPSQFPYLVKAAASQSQIFNKTGNPMNLELKIKDDNGTVRLVGNAISVEKNEMILSINRIDPRREFFRIDDMKEISKIISDIINKINLNK